MFMHYSKSMIEQIYVIRKSVPDDLKKEIKLADPNLLNTLIRVYWNIQDLVLRKRIEGVIQAAGPEWTSNLKTATDAPLSSKPAPIIPTELKEKAKQLKQLKYRGQNVDTASTVQASTVQKIAPKKIVPQKIKPTSTATNGVGRKVYRGQQI